MTKLWDRGVGLDARVESFTVGRDPELDRRLLPYDALASAAHAKMLGSIGILESADVEALLGELSAIARESRAGTFTISTADEDGHTAIENRLTDRLGDVGRRIHTGRSRNDQVIAALRLWGREAVLTQVEGALTVARRLEELAEEHRETALPGYTHTRQAMPSTLGFLFAAHSESLVDGTAWLVTAFRHLDRCPLGSASGYGVALPLDRAMVSELLGFERLQINALAVQNDRGKTEALALAAAGGVATDLARLAADLILFSSEELGFVSLSENVTTGSSIMPQKRNPDALELVRAGSARLRARQLQASEILGGLTSGYHRDLQLTKEPFLEGMEELTAMLATLLPVLDGLEVDRERSRAAIERATAATDALYGRVAEGEPFRTAYKAVAADPGAAVAGEPAESWRDRSYLGTPAQLGLTELGARRGRVDEWARATAERLARVWSLLPEQPAS